MKKQYLIHKKSKQVKMISDSVIDFDNTIFDLKELSPKKTDQDKIDQNYIIYYKNGKFKFEKPDHLNETVEDIKKELEEAKTVAELKEVITKII